MKKKDLKIKENISASIKNIGLFLLLSFISAIPLSLKLSTELSTIIGYLLTLILLFLMYKEIIIKDIKNIKDDFIKNRKNIILSFLSFTVLMYITNLILNKLIGTIATNEILVRDEVFSSPILMIPYICLLAPITEELIMKLPYKKCNTIISFILYTFIFAIIHIIGVTDITALYLISYLFLSLGISYSYYKTNNICISIMLHSLNNIITVILIMLGGK